MNWEDQWQLDKRAVIREAECIGCTKCIQACPVDAILGSAKLMHTVITDECTGCELCVAPCPVDCIDIKTVDIKEDIDARKNQFRARHASHDLRLKKEKIDKPKKEFSSQDYSIPAKKNYIEAALLRAKEKKNSS